MYKHIVMVTIVMVTIVMVTIVMVTIVMVTILYMRCVTVTSIQFSIWKIINTLMY